MNEGHVRHADSGGLENEGILDHADLDVVEGEGHVHHADLNGLDDGSVAHSAGLGEVEDESNEHHASLRLLNNPACMSSDVLCDLEPRLVPTQLSASLTQAVVDITM